MAWKSTKNAHIRDIISLIGVKPITPTMLSEKLNLHPVMLSRYLKILKNDKLVKVKRDQNQLWYSLNHNGWKKHVEETINLAGENFTVNFKFDHSSDGFSQKIKK